MRRVVITGLGILAPDAKDCQSFWDNLERGHLSIRKITKCDVSKLNIKFGGQIEDSGADKIINKRFLKKCDDFSAYSLVAVSQALKDAALDPGTMDNSKIGIYVGNNSGGWHSAEQGLRDLHFKGVEHISPFLASNWFPAAPQGHISILNNITGYSKTIAADMASSGIAIGNSYNLIKEGVVDYMIAGGTENLINFWGLLVYQTNPVVSTRNNGCSSDIYQPFGARKSGLVLCEGAAFVILESLESALRRGASIYCEVSGFAANNDGYHYWKSDPGGEQYARVIRDICIDDAIPDYVSLNGAAYENEDASEINGVKKAFYGRLDKIDCSCPKGFFGHSYGAAGAMDVIIAVLSMKNNKIIKTGTVSELSPGLGVRIVTGDHLDKEVNTCLVMNKGLGGINSALVLKRSDV